MTLKRTGCATCLTHRAWLAFNRLKQAHKTQAEFIKAIQFLEDQANRGLEEEKQLFRLSCNHPNVIPHWSEWWREGGQAGVLTGFWRCVCCTSASGK